MLSVACRYPRRWAEWQPALSAFGWPGTSWLGAGGDAVILTAVRADGTVPLGEDAARLGFRPGALVQVIVTRAGSLILALDDEPATVEAPCRPLPRRAREPLAIGRRAG